MSGKWQKNTAGRGGHFAADKVPVGVRISAGLPCMYITYLTFICDIPFGVSFTKI